MHSRPMASMEGITTVTYLYLLTHLPLNRTMRGIRHSKNCVNENIIYLFSFVSSVLRTETGRLKPGKGVEFPLQMSPYDLPGVTASDVILSAMSDRV